MKRRSLLLSAACLILASALPAAFAQGISPGSHYRVIDNPQPTSAGPGEVEVVELFWYGCPHCYSLESAVQRWVENKPEHVQFVRMAAVLGPSWAPHAQAFYAAEVLGVVEQIHQPLFNAIHAQRRRLNTPEALADFFAEQGIDRDEFLKAYNSFAVHVKVRRAQSMGRRYGVDGVPSFVVAGKYETSVGMAGSPANLFRVIEHLVALESGRAGG